MLIHELKAHKIELQMQNEDLRKAQVDLLASRNRYSQLFQNAPVGYLVLDEIGIIREVNETFCSMTGFDVAKVVGKGFSDLLVEPHQGRFLARYKALFKSPLGKRIEAEIRVRRGKPIWVRMEASMLSRSAEEESPEEAGRLLLTLSDITDLKAAEEALRESESRYREFSRQFVAVLEAIPDSLALIKVDHEVMWANSSAVNSMAQKDAYAPGEQCFKLWHGLSEPCNACALLEAISEGKPVNKHTSSKDGRSWEFRLIPIKDDAGAVTHCIRLARDITERQKLEARLREAQKMEAIGTLAGGIAHDFNNILSPIIGYTEMALDDVPDISPMRYDLEQVLRAANRARDLVKQILAFSRHGQEHQMTPMDVGMVVREALKLLRASLPSTIEIKQSIQSGMGVADATQIHQIVVNLCTNAAHAMEDKGVLSVSLESIDLREGDLALSSLVDLMPGSYLKLSVSDTGHGMSPETMNRIFEPYFTTKEVGKGTGLGLAVVHGIVKRHGGGIRVRSVPGRGSAFDVYIPEAMAAPKQAIALQQDIAKGKGRILLVDDERMIIEVGTKMLTQLGYSVTGKDNPLEALDLFLSDPHAFDLIITDYTMPHLTGLDLAKEVLKTKADMPIILATGFSEKVTSKSAGSMGIRKFIMKPFNHRELSTVISEILRA